MQVLRYGQGADVSGVDRLLVFDPNSPLFGPSRLPHSGGITASRSVPIILMEDVWNLGKKGEIVTVRPGYMRNCLVLLQIGSNRVVPWKEGHL